jgi:hypothetical protein
MAKSIFAFADVGDAAIRPLSRRARFRVARQLNRVTMMNSTRDAKLFSRLVATWNVALRSCRFPQLPAIRLCDQSARGRYDDVMIAEGAQQAPLLEGVLDYIAAVVVEMISSGDHTIVPCDVPSTHADGGRTPLLYCRRACHSLCHSL